MKIKETILGLIFLLSFSITYSQTKKLCNANFGYTIKYEISPLTYQFIDSSTSQNTIVKWEWDFGNGETSLKQNPEHQYLSTGTYIVSLDITDQMGLTNRIERTIKIEDIIPPSCNAFFTYMLDTLAPNFTYKFFDHSIHTNDSITSWTWNFGDGSSLSHIENPIHQYSNLGNYTVSLSISTILGYNSTYATNITINNGGLSCDANFTWAPDTNSGSPYTVLFHDNSLYLDPIQSWTWYFGDGDSSEYQNPSHTFPYAGIYSVKLKIVTTSCSDEIEIPIQVANPQKYNLWGRVYVGNLTTDKCIAYLYRDYQNNHIIPIDTVELTSVNDTLGVYYFYQITEGSLKVKVILPPNSQFASDFAPTYYNSSPLWQYSQNIPLFQDLGSKNVDMRPILNQTGTNYIEGTVFNQANGQNEDVLVFLENSQNDIINYTFTDANGNYSFSQVPQGQFFIYGDLAGFTSNPASGNFTTSNDSLLGINFIIETSTINAFINNSEIEDKYSFEIYPNPTSEGRIYLRFNKKSPNKLYYRLFDSMGSFVKEESLSNYNFINVDKLQKGIYIINIIDSKSNNLGVKKVIVQ